MNRYNSSSYPQAAQSTAQQVHVVREALLGAEAESLAACALEY